jgi:hypothetical protein
MKDDIIKLARQAGWRESFTPPVVLYRFAALLLAAEREACAELAFDMLVQCEGTDFDVPDAIRARGQDPMPLFDDWPGGFK